jgi:hypothetical protein
VGKREEFLVKGGETGVHHHPFLAKSRELLQQPGTHMSPLKPLFPPLHFNTFTFQPASFTLSNVEFNDF